MSGALGSLEASWLPLQRRVHAACLCALQALKRKPDLFLCSNLDVKAVFQCGEYHGHGHVLQITEEKPACSSCRTGCKTAKGQGLQG